jgi:aminopeptidase C
LKILGGKSEASEGYYIMGDKWFDGYVCEIKIHKKYLPEEQNNIL